MVGFIFEKVKNIIIKRELLRKNLTSRLLENMQRYTELPSSFPAPPEGEFNKIMEELNRRKKVTTVRKQLKILYLGYSVFFILQKPLMILMVVLMLLVMP